MAIDVFQWSAKTPSSLTTRLRDAAYSSSLGRWCVVGDYDGSTQCVCVTSDNDGDSWTIRNTGYTGSYFLGITWGNGLFVAVGGDGSKSTPPAIYTSPDGITWTSRSLSKNCRYLWKVLWTGTNFVTCGLDGACATSPDGITWTQRTVPGTDQTDETGETFYQMDYDGTSRIVMNNQNTGMFYYSDDDGINWAVCDTSATIAFGGLNSMIWTGSCWFAIGGYVYRRRLLDDTINAMISSDDGYTWAVENEFPYSDLNCPKFYRMVSDRSGEGIIIGNMNPAWSFTGTSGNIVWKQLPDVPNRHTYWYQGGYYGNGYYIVCGDANYYIPNNSGNRPLLSKGWWTSYNSATAPSPANQPYATSGTNITPVDSILSWTGIGTGTHAVYLGVNPDNLNFEGNVGVSTEYDPGGLEYNTSYWWRVDTIDGGDTNIGEQWHFVTEPQYTLPDDELTVHAGTDNISSSSSESYPYTEIVVFDHEDLIHGHRYLIMHSGKWYASSATIVTNLFLGNRAECVLNNANPGPWENPNYNFEMYQNGRGVRRSYSSTRLTQQSAAIVTPVGGDDLVWCCYLSTGSATRYQCYCMAIDLDSPGMVEGVDWWGITEARYTTPTAWDTWEDVPNGSITFTPDGYSDYLVIANPNWYTYNASSSYRYTSRIYDTIDGVIGLTGQYAASTTQDYQHGQIMQWVLASPPATERTVSLQFYHDDPGTYTPHRLYGSTLFIMRLSKFEKVKFTRKGTSVSGLSNYMPPYGTNQQDATQALIKYTPDDKGTAIFLFGSENDPYSYSGSNGIVTSIRYGTESSYSWVFNTETYPPGGTVNTSDAMMAILYIADHRVPYYCPRKFTGLSDTKPVYLFQSSVSVQDEITRQSLVVLGTKYLDSPAVYNFSPPENANLVAKTDPISFTIRGPHGVDRNTLNVDITPCVGWAEYDTGESSLSKVNYGNGLWIAVGNAGKIITSTDGYSWTSRTSGTSENLGTVVYGGGIWVAAGANETFLSSPDGITWTDRTPGGASSKYIYEVVYGDGQFVAVGQSGSIWTSPDGINWTSRIFDALYRYAIGFDSVNTLFCTVGWNGIIHTSSDGITWTSRSSGTYEALYGIDHDQQGRWIVPVLYTPQILTSTNGINWSVVETYLPFDADLRDVAYGQGKWVVTGTSGTSLASTDGLNWYRTKNYSVGTLNYPAYGDGAGWLIAVSNGNILTSPTGGLIDTPVSAVINGIIQPGFDESGAQISELDGYDGYSVTLMPAYSTFEKNSMFIVKVNVDDHYSNSMDEYETTFSNVDGHLYLQQYVSDTMTSSTGWQTNISLPPGTFNDGHRYLFMYTHSYYSYSGSYYNYVCLEFNGEYNYNWRGLLRWYGSSSPYCYIQHSPIIVREMSGSDSFEVRTYLSNNYNAYGNQRLILIDLDSDPGSFVENDNWFFNGDYTRKSNMDETWTNNVGASITFTPDGVSDYLILGCSFFDSHGAVSNSDANIRIYDSVLGELVESMYEGYSTQSSEAAKTVMYVMEAPAAASRTVSIQMRGEVDWDCDHSELVIIKLDSFVKKDWAQTLTTLTGIPTSDTVVETINFDSDTRKDQLVLSYFEAEQYMRQEIDVNSSNLLAHPNTESSTTYFRQGYSGTSSWEHNGILAALRLQGYVDPTVEALCASYSTSYDLLKRNLVVLGTEFYVPPPAKATNPDPSNSESDVALDQLLSWDAAERAITYDVYFGTDADPSGNFIGNQTSTVFDPPGQYLELAETYYWRIDSVGDGGTTTGDVWTFDTVLTVPAPTKATNPDPTDDETDVSVDKILSWTSGTSILEVSHDIYFGTDADPSGNYITNQLPASFDPGYLNPKTNKLTADTDYYWRIDERNVGGVTTGDVWHFTTEYIAPPNKATNPSPGNGFTGIIPDENLTWVAGSGAVSHDVYFGTNPDPSGNYIGNQISTTYNPPTDLSINQTYYWRIDEVGPGGITTGDVWNFTTIEVLPLPSKATAPRPANERTGVSPDSALAWTSGTGIPYIGTITHDVYFGEDPDPSGNFKTNTASTGYSPGLLEYSKTYYWRIDEVSAVSGTQTGDVWSFSTAPMLVIEPRNGDLCYESIYIRGNTAPYVGVHVEVHSDHLIGDGYSTTDADGDFEMRVAYTNQPYGTSIRLCLVTRASPDSEEVTINLIQGRAPLEVVRLRTSRQQNADANTVALWRFGKASLAPPNPSGKVVEDFYTADKYTPPQYWNRAGTPGFGPTWEDGVMTVHCYNTPGIYSRSERSYADTVARFDLGCRVRFNCKAVHGNEYCPTEGDQMLYFTRFNSAHQFGLHLLESGLVQVGNSAQYLYARYDPPYDRFEWMDIDAIGYETVQGDASTRYLEVYVNRELIVSASATATASGTSQMLGQAFTNNDGSFVATNFGYYFVLEGNPFIAAPGTNVQGDTNADLGMLYGVGPRKNEDHHDVPFDYALEFNGWQGLLSSTNSAFNITGAFTIEGWIYTDPNTLGSSERVICGKQSLNSSGWVLRIGTGRTLQAAFYSGTEQTLDSGTVILEGTWYHVALVWTGAYAYLYVNGDLKTYTSLGYTENTSQPFRFGSYSESASPYWNGRFADFRLSNIARSSAEIHNVYYAISNPQLGFPTDSGSLAVYNFDEPEFQYGYLSSSSHRRNTDRTSIEFSSIEDWEDFFRSDFTPNGGPISVEVIDTRLRVTYDHTAGVDQWAYLPGYGKHRLTGDFDVTVTIRISNWVDPPWDTDSCYIFFYLTSVTGRSAALRYEPDRYGTDQDRILMRFYIYDSNEYISIDINSPDEVPDVIKFRMARKSCMWYGYYGFDDDPPTTFLGKASGPSEDCIMQFLAYIHAATIPTGTYYYEIESIDVKGWNNDEETDGYLIQEVHGMDAYGVGWNTAYRPSAVGLRARNYSGTSSTQIPDHADWDHQDLSVEVWFQADSLQDAKLMARLGKSYSAGWYISLNSDGTITAEITDSGGNTVSVTGGNYVPLAWHCIAITFDLNDSGRLKLYQDGILITSSTMSSSTGDFSSNIPIDIGRESKYFGEYYDGAVGAIRISNVVRSAKEIFDYFNGSNIKETR